MSIQSVRTCLWEGRRRRQTREAKASAHLKPNTLARATGGPGDGEEATGAEWAHAHNTHGGVRGWKREKEGVGCRVGRPRRLGQGKGGTRSNEVEVHRRQRWLSPTSPCSASAGSHGSSHPVHLAFLSSFRRFGRGCRVQQKCSYNPSGHRTKVYNFPADRGRFERRDRFC